MFKILIAEDEQLVLEPVFDYLTSKGFSVTCAENGQAAVEKAENESFDLIILDVMMPVMNGLEACKRIREITDAPILFLSALGEESDLLSGYRNGCDDYIVKPFPLAVLTEKCSSMIKRYKKLDSESKITITPVTADLSSNRVFVRNREISLSKIDYELLFYLMENKGIILNRELILTRIWGYDFDGDIRVVDTHIKRIRNTLGDGADIIKTVFGVGYTVQEVEK